MQLQEGSQVHPFYSTLMKYGNDEVPVNCVTNCEWDVIEQAIDQGTHHIALDPYNAYTVK